MQLGMIGLGRMGANMVRRLQAGGPRVRGLRRARRRGRPSRARAPSGAASLADLRAGARPPRAVWLMVPAGGGRPDARRCSSPLLEPDDVIIDGGNSHYHDDIRRAGELRGPRLHYVDVGTSGGVWGLERGFCLMIGGEAPVVQRLDPIFEALAPGIGAAPRTAGPRADRRHRRARVSPLRADGAGHFVKMVHNGIEYGLMAAYAEGLNILHHANAGARRTRADAETSPLRTPEHYRYDLDLRDITEVWRRGSVVASWLLDLTASALDQEPDLGELLGPRVRLGRGPLDDRRPPSTRACPRRC